MPRQAMVLIADEILFNLYGKVFLHGVYNNDLIIPRDPSGSPQLIFYFAIETDISEPFQSLHVEVTLPGAQLVRNVVFIPSPQLIAAQAKANPARLRFNVRHPLIIPNPVLQPGR